MDAKHNINDLSVTSLKLGSFDDISLPEMLSLIKKKFQTDTSFEWDKIFDWAAIKYPIIDPFQYKKDTISDVLKILQSALSKDECLFYLKSISHLMSKINHKITFGSSDFLIVQEELIRWFPENKDLRREHFNDFNKFTNKNYTHLEALAQYKKYESINHIKAWLNWFIGNHTTRNNSEGLSFLVDYSYKNEDKKILQTIIDSLIQAIVEKKTMPYLNTILHEFNFKNNTNENKLLDTIISNKKYADSVSLKDFCRMDPEFITWLNSESSDWSAVNVEYFITNSINYFSIVSFIQRNPESSIEVLDTFFTHCGHLLDSVLIEQISYSLSRENYVYKDKVSDYFNEKYPDIDSVIHPFIFMLPHKKDEIIRFHGCYELMSLNASDFHSKILNYLVMDQEPNNEYAKDIEFDVLSL